MKDREKSSSPLLKLRYFLIKDKASNEERGSDPGRRKDDDDDDDDDAFFRRRKKRRRFFPRVARVSSRAVRAFGHGRPNVTASAERRFSDVHV